MISFLRDMALSARALCKRPGFAIVSIVTLALGIGATTAIFSVVNAVLLRPLPFSDPDRLVLLCSTQRGADGKAQEYGLSVPDLRDTRDRQRTLAGAAAMEAGSVNLTGAREPERVPAGRVTTNLLDVLGVPPALGRAFGLEDENAPVALIGHGLWQRLFAGDPGVLGKTLSIDGAPHAVVGVVPRGFRFMEPAEVLVPLKVSDPGAKRQFRQIYGVGRLAPGVPLQRANAEMDGVARRLAAEFPETNTGWGLKLIPLRDVLVKEVRPALLILLAAVGFVLLIACANVSNLLVVRAIERQGEIAIRTALGADRRAIIRQTLAESTLLGLVGGALGIAVSFAALGPLLAAAPGDLSNLPPVRIDLAVLAFTVAVSLGTGVLFGLAPAFLASRDLHAAMRQGGRGSSGAVRGRRLQAALVVSEVALSFLLLFGAALTVKGFRSLLHVDPGFSPQGVTLFELTLPAPRFDPAARSRVVERILDRLASVPGVRSAGTSTKLPLKELAGLTVFIVEGRAPTGTGETEFAHFRRISPKYLATIGTPFLEGRDFSWTDTDGGPGVAIVSRAFAKKYWPGTSALGKRIQRKAPGQPWLEIVGVVADVADMSLGKDSEPALYIPYAQGAIPPLVNFAVRATSSEARLAPALRRAVWDVDPDLPLANLAPMDTLVALSLTRQRFAMLLLTFLGAAGLAIASVGIYGVVSYTAGQRTREIGIRMALGATARSVSTLVVRHGAGLALAGVAAGAGGSLVLAGSLAKLVGRIRPADPVVFLATSLGLFLVALLASYVPARRAAALEPAVCLKGE